MTDNRFEDRLEALFDTPPALDGDLSFAVGVQQRLARAARWREDLTAAAWAVTGVAVIWALWLVADALQWIPLAVGAMDPAALQNNVWLLPALAVGGVLAFQAFEEGWARD